MGELPADWTVLHPTPVLIPRVEMIGNEGEGPPALQHAMPLLLLRRSAGSGVVWVTTPAPTIHPRCDGGQSQPTRLRCPRLPSRPTGVERRKSGPSQWAWLGPLGGGAGPLAGPLPPFTPGDGKDRSTTTEPSQNDRPSRWRWYV